MNQSKVLLDLNAPKCQEGLFLLQKDEIIAVFRTFKKIKQMSWQQVYQDQGLKWEATSCYTDEGQKIYSFRFSQKYRATAIRIGDYMRILGLHSDHDSAYH